MAKVLTAFLVSFRSIKSSGDIGCRSPCSDLSACAALQQKIPIHPGVQRRGATGFVKDCVRAAREGRGDMISHFTKRQGSWFFRPMGLQEIICYLFVHKM